RVEIEHDMAYAVSKGGNSRELHNQAVSKQSTTRPMPCRKATITESYTAKPCPQARKHDLCRVGVRRNRKNFSFMNLWGKGGGGLTCTAWMDAVAVLASLAWVGDFRFSAGSSVAV
ncbi:hypothetical protein ACLOJK_004861, partial [Asimina triloba]